MNFDGWPNIQDKCPVCGRANCASYRGYYERNFICTELEFVGKLVIRTGYCKNKHFRFSLILSFVTYQRILSIKTITNLTELFVKHKDVFTAVNLLTEDLDDEFYLSLSTAYKAIQWRLKQPP